MREFNITGTCIPEKHYMVDITPKLAQIIEMIDEGRYFTINRARQYGKTTTLAALSRELKERYLVLRISFEGVGAEAFADGRSFVRMFIRKMERSLLRLGMDGERFSEWGRVDEEALRRWGAFEYLSERITALCQESTRGVLLMVDEVDKSTENQIFLDFLGMLRSKYLDREEGADVTFQSVILAGVYDIKNLKLNLRPEEERRYNSPWNIAADFKVDMSFSAEEISTMLREYERDWHTGMDLARISGELYFLTGGYPSLVSRLCKWIDEQGERDWTIAGVRKAERELLKERNTLFDDLIKNVENHRELKEFIGSILLDGRSYAFQISDSVIELGVILGIFVERAHNVAISNVMFETYLYDHTASEWSRRGRIAASEDSSFVREGKLDMCLVLVKFQEFMKAEYRREDEQFLEQQGRLLFLCFLKPIINGKGFYYVEPETRGSSRMDIVAAYGGEEFVIELKWWRGKAYRRDGIRQLERYMESRSCENGFLVSFSFLKNKTYRCGYVTEDETEKRIFEVVV